MKKIAFFLLISTLLAIGCKKENGSKNPGGTEIIDFDWKTTSPLTLEVTTDIEPVNEFNTVKVFTNASLEASDMIASGSLAPDRPFRTAITIPTAVESLFVVVKETNGRSKTYKCDVVSTQDYVTLNTATAPEYELKNKTTTPTPPEIVLPDPADYTILTTAPTTIENGAKYLVPEGSTIEITDRSLLCGWSATSPVATFYVAGTLKLNEAASGIQNIFFVVLSGGKIEGAIINFSKFYVDSPDNPDGRASLPPVIYVMEGGEIEIKDIHLQNELKLVNKGIITCEKFTTHKDTHTHIGGRLTATEKLSLNWSYDNYVYIYPGALLEATKDAWLSEATITMYHDAIVFFNWMIPNTGKFVTPAGEEKAFIRIDGINNHSFEFQIDGPIEVFMQNLPSQHRDKILGRLHNGAYLVESWENRQYYIGNNGINLGYGEFDIQDKDGDGVPANEDIDDNDPNVAYRSYYPSATEYATVMFEDLWPEIGDYDMNDIVSDFRIEWTTNTANEVVYMTYRWKLRAAGTMYRIGMGMQLDDVFQSEIKSITNTFPLRGNTPFSATNGLETGVSKAIIPLFNDIEDIAGSGNRVFINTTPDLSHIYMDGKSVTIHFNNPIDIERVKEEKINIFLVIAESGQTALRENEIHLSSYKQTEKGKVLENHPSVHPDNNYLTVDGKMWGLMIPQSIAYPLEYNNIETVYNHYRAWYLSGGAEYKDWYQNKPGYINHEKTYVEPNIFEEPEE